MKEHVTMELSSSAALVPGHACFALLLSSGPLPVENDTPAPYSSFVFQMPNFVMTFRPHNHLKRLSAFESP